MSDPVSRRDFFERLAAPIRRIQDAAMPSPAQPAETNVETPAVARVAVIQGRYCLAYTSICSVCVERCPVPGAIEVTRGIPMVVPEVCTGCGVCHEVCPAPRNAILQVPRRPMPPLRPLNVPDRT